MNEQRIQEIQKVLYDMGENSMAVDVRQLWSDLKKLYHQYNDLSFETMKEIEIRNNLEAR